MYKAPHLRPVPVLYLALAGDLLVAIAKFAGAAFTGSSALSSEGIHSVVDAGTELLLLYGLRSARRPSTAEHQLGFGREVFFWNFIVALTILGVGAGAALLDGVHQILHPVPVQSSMINYGVLFLALLAEIPALVGVVKTVQAKRGSTGFVRYVSRSRDSTMLTVLFGSATGISGLLVAVIGTILSDALHSPVWDGLSSVLIAVILAASALFLARNSKRLLIGVPAAPATVRAILAITTEHPDVQTANGAVSVHLAPDQVLMALSVAFRPTLTTGEIELAVTAIDRAVRAAHPSICIFLLKPQSAAQFASVRTTRGW